MTELSDYKRIIEAANNRAYEAKISALRDAVDAAEARAQRAEEALSGKPVADAPKDRAILAWAIDDCCGPRDPEFHIIRWAVPDNDPSLAGWWDNDSDCDMIPLLWWELPSELGAALAASEGRG